MQVYVEYALIENFSMDLVLLLVAKRVSKNPVGFAKLAVCATLGSSFAVLFPLFGLEGFLSVLVKFLSGLVLCLVAGQYATFYTFFKFTCAFFSFTFLTGGALYAVFYCFNLPYMGGYGYLITRIPVGIPLLFALALSALVRYFLKKRKGVGEGAELVCTLTYHGSTVTLHGFFDTGNRVYSGGRPVSILPPYVRYELGMPPTHPVTVRTVTGSQKIAVFTADELKIYCADKSHIIKNVQVGFSHAPLTTVVLHPDLKEIVC